MTSRTSLLAIFLLLCGCTRPPVAIAPTKPPEVVVEKPVVREVVDFEDFTGRLEASEQIDLRARVGGYLDAVLFKDGADVKKGDPLFRIDQRTYKAEVEKTRAVVRQRQATVDRLTKDYERTAAMKGASPQELDKIVGDKAEAEASLAAVEADLKIANQNLDFTGIVAPIDGRMSRRYADPGNLIRADDTVLSTIVALDPICANFDIDSRTVIRVRKLIREGKMVSARSQRTVVQIGLADDEGFPFEGVVDFVDNKLDVGTSTLRVRAVVSNSDKILSPGMFVRVRVPIGLPRKAILVPDEAIGTDQGQKFLYVLNDQDEVEYRRIRPGKLFDRLRLVESENPGLGENERVIVSGLQRVRPKAKVTPRAAGTASKKSSETTKSSER